MIEVDRGLGHDAMEDILRLVRARTGLVFAQPRRSQFTVAVQTCMRRAGITDLTAYLGRLTVSAEAFDDLAAEITVGESYFLRDAAQWQLLRSRVLPELLARREGTLRIWSAGCASGEEPYSMAIVLQQMGAGERARILGTDLSRPALARAARGIYGPWSLRDVPDDVRRGYFRQSGGRLEVLPSLRRRVEFAWLNLAAGDWPRPGSGPHAMDLILCRNVLIYLDQATVVRVASRLLECLAEGGYLLLGASDPVISTLVPCDVEITQAGLVYRRAAPAAERTWWVPAASTARMEPGTVAPPPPVAQSAPREPVVDMVRARYAERDYAGAADAARSALEAGESSAAVAVLLIRALANQGNLPEAGQACAAALDLHRSEAELVYLHAVLLSQAGHHAEAAGALRQALYLDRDLIVAHLALGDVLARAGEREGAMRAFRTAERLLADWPAERVVPASDGEPAVRLAEHARARIRLLEASAA